MLDDSVIEGDVELFEFWGYILVVSNHLSLNEKVAHYSEELNALGLLLRSIAIVLSRQFCFRKCS